MAKDDFMEFDETKFDPGHITEQNLTKEMHDDMSVFYTLLSGKMHTFVID